MASKAAISTNAQVRQCEILAQKLYAQCRDSKSAYKSLTSSLRNLRNLLSELDEILDIRLEPGPQDVKILYRIVDGIAVLQKLDIGHQSFKCSSQVEVDLATVAGFKTSLDGITYDLSKAYDAMARSNETGSSACSSSSKRRSSQTSSAWSMVHRDAGSDISSEGIEVHHPSDEKEVYLSRGILSTSSLTSLSTAAPSWSSMFTDIDPLSIPLDDAAKLFFYDNEGDDDVSESETDPIPAEAPEDDHVDETGMEVDAVGGAETDTVPGGASSHNTDNHGGVAIDRDRTLLSPVEIEQLRQDSVLSSPLTPTKERLSSGHLSPRGTGILTSAGDIAASPSCLKTPTIELTTPDSDGDSEEDKDGAKDGETAAKIQEQEQEAGDLTGLSDDETTKTVGPDERDRLDTPRTVTESTSTDPEQEQASTGVEDAFVGGSRARNSPLQGFGLPDTSKDGHGLITLGGMTVVVLNETETESQTSDDVSDAQVWEDTIEASQEKRETSCKENADRQVPTVKEVEVTEANGIASRGNEPPDEEAAENMQLQRSSVESTRASTSQPSMPNRAPPPPPPPLHSKPVLPHATSTQPDEVSTLLRAPSPTPSEASEDLYSSTPPRKPALFDDFKLEPLKLAEIPPLQIKFAEKETKSSTDVEKTAAAGPALRRSEGFRKGGRYYAYFASDEYYRSGAVKTDKPLPSIPAKDQSPVLSKSSSCGALARPEEEAQDLEKPTAKKSTAKKSAGLSVPTRYLHARRKSAPPPASASLVPPVEQRPQSNHTLDDITEKSAALQVAPPALWAPRRSVDEALRSRDDPVQATAHKPEWESPDLVGVTEFYGDKAREATPASMLDQQRVQHIISFWNNRRWDEAVLYLVGHMESLEARSETVAVRRVKHLLAVCSSFRGDWQNAIERFIEVIRRPVTNVFHLDDGDCAAAYWLGDLYAMQNRRADALLAYSLAERSTLFSDIDPLVQLTISAEQAAVQIGVSKADFKQRWDESKIGRHESLGILDPMIVSIEAAKQCLDTEARKFRDPHSTFVLAPGKSRSNYLGSFQQSKAHSALFETMAMKIDTDVFDPSAPWPMMYDPLFCMANVQRSRLLAYECDMLAVFETNLEAKLPRPLSLKKIDCFTCNDLPWLIQTLRACLKTYETGYSEVVNISGVWFCCRYSFMQHRIATTHYFAISLFKHPFRSGFGVDVCSEDMSSARLVGSYLEYQNGVHASEPKRIKHLVREYLDEAWKARSKILKAAGSTAVPPLPPRPA